MRSVFLILFLAVSGFPALAQKETNTWILGRQHWLNFNTDPPGLILTPELPLTGGPNASISDAEGRLLFFTDGMTVYTPDHTVMADGILRPGEFINSVVIVPKPRSPQEYYIITAAVENGVPFSRYALVDMRLGDGRGKVAQKNRPIAPSIGFLYTAVVGNCDNSVFWIVEGGMSTFHAFKIDENGISTTPVISPVAISNGYVAEYKLSPQGNRVVFNSITNDNYSLNFADFDLETGKVTNASSVVNRSLMHFEFSPNGQVLYATEGLFIYSDLVQFDLRPTTAEAIQRTKTLIARDAGLSDWPSLASNGKIYGIHAQAVIENPNQLGPGCDYRTLPLPIEEINLSSWNTTFVRTFLREGGYSGIAVNAGKDAEICSGQAYQLGAPATDPSLKYRWSPAAHLSNPDSPNPVFRYSLAPGDTLSEFTYTLTVTRGSCANSAPVRIQVRPETPLITGPRSVCPRVEGVEYRVAERAGQTYQWRISGGTIISGQGTAAITVDWGPANPAAWVAVDIAGQTYCNGSTPPLPVRINVELDTETPRGPDSVCVNQRAGNVYQLTPTRGSVYTWDLTGGTIREGQGTARVTVDWELAGPHRIWVQEQSITRDTVCFGTSEVRAITVFTDDTSLDLQYVSVSLDDEQRVEIHWTSSDPGRLPGPLRLFRRPANTADWQPVAANVQAGLPVIDAEPDTDEESYEYLLETANRCAETLRTNVHSTIRLTSQHQEGNGQLTLRWNAYQGWPGGVERYEIWRQLDNEETMQPVAQVNGTVLSFADLSILDGFSHRFRIRAIARESGFVSWSNELALEFSHEISVPNVFTPNGDGYNDTFVIPLLELYPENQLTVVNRWGQSVYQTEGYRNDWTAAGLPTGVYYYSLLLRRSGKVLSGWIQVIR